MTEPAAQPPVSTPARKVATGLILGLALAALFARLGHYALWDDEAGTALSAIGIWRTGDTTALIDHNLAAYDSGKDLRNLHERLMPPLPGYLAAPFIGVLGRNSWAARLPFALCGLACVGLMLGWVWKARPPLSTLLFFGLALLTNVSFFLYFRQCRYYGVAMLSSVVMAWVYVHWRARISHPPIETAAGCKVGTPRRGVRYPGNTDASARRPYLSVLFGVGRHWQIVLFSLASLCLFTSNYLNWAAFYVCLAVDYLAWGRKHIRLRGSDWAILLLPQALIGGAVFLIWNPLLIVGAGEKFPEVGKLRHVWWCARDIVACEFGAPALVLTGLVLWWTGRERNPWLPRACLCLLLYIVVIGLLEPHPASLRGVAFVRYFAPIIPLFIAISTITLAALYRLSRPAALGLAAVALGTNLLNGGPLLSSGIQCTPAKFALELIDPPGDPFAITAEWLRQHVEDRATVWVVPDYATYPLMYHAPNPTYTWQLTWPPAKEEFKSLPPVFFIGQVVPQYIVAFGPATQLAQESLASWNRPDVQYAPAATLDFFWKDNHRPELFWRTFRPITTYDRATEAIYIFKLKPS